MNSRSKVVTGSILVLAGGLTLIGNLQLLNENFVLPIMGAAFLFVYFILGARKNYRNIGFLIPGIILPGLQILKFADDYKVSEKTEILTVFGVLGASFLAIYFIHSFWYKEISKGQRNWPLYVSIILFVFGGITYAVEYFNWSFGMVIINNIWPGVLIIVGARMLYKAIKGNKEKINE
ncbi:hypothetical protein JK636_16415 [Clostridium sp. YIM B02515]|uniref:DUF5668 domain-containing protein n=1 Tax=Clostridium rhizosphaerae TaxID=2803861 RepID=A0ABS1TD76_9CLOT|nr:hypothetical protein [Clostridium rhizosphaerae]MBL4937314.1 hypothetical protein [Clostridium rhizosphaerae]